MQSDITLKTGRPKQTLEERDFGGQEEEATRQFAPREALHVHR